MNIVLINPPSKKVYEVYDAPPWPHIGLAYLAAYLRQGGYGCHIIDAKFEKLSFAQTISRIKSIKPDLVGLTAFTHEVSQSARLADWIKENIHSCFVVLGGVHATFLPTETMVKFNYFDAVVIGEGEITLLEIIQSLESRRRLKDVLGIAFRNNGEIKVNEGRSFVENLDDLPLPAYDLFPKASFYIIQTARGCPYQCNFCSNPWTRKTRYRSPQNVFQEFKQLSRNDEKPTLTFADETFGVNRKRTEALLNLIIKEGLNEKVHWWASTRVDAVSRDYLMKFKEAGCEYLGFGIESGNPDILEATGKGINLTKAKQAIMMAKDVGIKTGAYFILGHPFESPRTAVQTIKFAAKLKTDSLSLGIMVPYPGSKIHEMAIHGKGGYKIISDNWDDFNKQYGNALELQSLSRRQLEFFQMAGYLYFYLYDFRIRDIFDKFKRYLPLLGHIIKKILMGSRN